MLFQVFRAPPPPLSPGCPKQKKPADWRIANIARTEIFSRIKQKKTFGAQICFQDVMTLFMALGKLCLTLQALPFMQAPTSFARACSNQATPQAANPRPSTSETRSRHGRDHRPHRPEKIQGGLSNAISFFGRKTAHRSRTGTPEKKSCRAHLPLGNHDPGHYAPPIFELI